MRSKVRTYGRQHRAITAEACRRRRQSYMQDSFAALDSASPSIPQPMSKTPKPNKLKRRSGPRMSGIPSGAAIASRRDSGLSSDTNDDSPNRQLVTILSSNDESDYSQTVPSESCYSEPPSDHGLPPTATNAQVSPSLGSTNHHSPKSIVGIYEPLDDLVSYVQKAQIAVAGQASRTPHTDVQDINAKLTAMVVASESLAANRIQRRTNSLSTPRGPRVSHRVTNVFNRLSSPKSSHPPSTPRRRLQKVASTTSLQISLDLMAEVPNLSRASLSTIQLRLNEGDNLNRAKVQRIIGGSLKRKPVPTSGKLSRMTDRPSQYKPTETIDSYASTTLDSRILDLSEEESQTEHSLCLSADLFEAETAFDDNIEVGILSMSPMGSSTPRICVVQSPSGAAQAVSNTPASSISELDLDSSSGGLFLSMETPERVTTPKSCDSNAMDRGPSISHQFSNRKKKHPSPSKHALESLEVALQGYFREKGRSERLIGSDELALKPHMLPGLLQPKDPNTLMQQTAPANIPKPTARSQAAKVLSRHRGQQIGLKYARDSRLGAACPLSSPAQVDDLDELCY